MVHLKSSNCTINSTFDNVKCTIDITMLAMEFAYKTGDKLKTTYNLNYVYHLFYIYLIKGLLHVKKIIMLHKNVNIKIHKGYIEFRFFIKCLHYFKV